MKIFLLLFSLFYQGVSAQNQIEANPYVQKDWYKHFYYSLNSISNNKVTLKGLSYGLDVNYKIPIAKHLHLKSGLGYYRYRFNKIENINSRFGRTESRHINYPWANFLLLSSDKYHYHTASIALGIERSFLAKPSCAFFLGFDINPYFTLGQSYHLNYYHPFDPIENPYKLTDTRFFGVATELHAGILKKSGKLTLGPELIVPAFSLWKKDKLFIDERSSDSRNKWLRGIGLGLKCSYALNKNQHK